MLTARRAKPATLATHCSMFEWLLARSGASICKFSMERTFWQSDFLPRRKRYKWMFPGRNSLGLQCRCLSVSDSCWNSRSESRRTLRWRWMSLGLGSEWRRCSGAGDDFWWASCPARTWQWLCEGRFRGRERWRRQCLLGLRTRSIRRRRAGGRLKWRL